MLFARLLVEESDYPDLNIATYAAYSRILAFIRKQGYPYLLRIWNYFPDINQECGGLERYKAFCMGRHKALLGELADFETRLPAACAIVTQKPGLLIYCLAAQQPGIQVESPRQMSAFHYPLNMVHSVELPFLSVGRSPQNVGYLAILRFTRIPNNLQEVRPSHAQL